MGAEVKLFVGDLHSSLLGWVHHLRRKPTGSCVFCVAYTSALLFAQENGCAAVAVLQPRDPVPAVLYSKIGRLPVNT